MKQKLTKLEGKVDKFTIVFGDFIIPLLVTDKISSRKIRNIDNLNNSVNQFNLIDYNVTHSNSRIQFFSNTYRTFTQDRPAAGPQSESQ